MILKTAPADYVYIKAWGQYHRVEPEYIEIQQIKACEFSAPLSAIYQDDNDNPASWATLSDIKSKSVTTQIIQDAETLAANLRVVGDIIAWAAYGKIYSGKIVQITEPWMTIDNGAYVHVCRCTKEPQ